jgi:hypothetical protein
MCMGGSKAPVQQAPPPPPPPPPVLEQTAPKLSAPTSGEADNRNATGTKQYRTSLAIGSPIVNPGMTSNNSGLGISM